MKRLLPVLLFLLILSGVGLLYYVSSQPETYVLFASSDNLTSDLRGELIIRLKANNIPYHIDNKGNIHIPETKVQTAIICCS